MVTLLLRTSASRVSSTAWMPWSSLQKQSHLRFLENVTHPSATTMMTSLASHPWRSLVSFCLCRKLSVCLNKLVMLNIKQAQSSLHFSVTDCEQFLNLNLYMLFFQVLTQTVWPQQYGQVEKQKPSWGWRGIWRERWKKKTFHHTVYAQNLPFLCTCFAGKSCWDFLWYCFSQSCLL